MWKELPHAEHAGALASANDGKGQAGSPKLLLFGAQPPCQILSEIIDFPFQPAQGAGHCET